MISAFEATTELNMIIMAYFNFLLLLFYLILIAPRLNLIWLKHCSEIITNLFIFETCQNCLKRFVSFCVMLKDKHFIKVFLPFISTFITTLQLSLYRVCENVLTVVCAKLLRRAVNLKKRKKEKLGKCEHASMASQ